MTEMNPVARDLHLSSLMFAADSMDERIRGHGVTEADWDAFTSFSRWIPQDRQRHQRTFHALQYGMLVDSGVEPLQLPPDYLAACLTLTVHRRNLKLACCWFATTVQASMNSLIPSNALAQPSTVTPDELFALCWEFVHDPGLATAIERFDTMMVYVTRRVNPADQSAIDLQPQVTKGAKK